MSPYSSRDHSNGVGLTMVMQSSWSAMEKIVSRKKASISGNYISLVAYSFLKVPCEAVG
jgi:hypothetical protein